MLGNLRGELIGFYNNYSNLLGSDLAASGGGGTTTHPNGNANTTAAAPPPSNSSSTAGHDRRRAQLAKLQAAESGRTTQALLNQVGQQPQPPMIKPQTIEICHNVHRQGTPLPPPTQQTRHLYS